MQDILAVLSGNDNPSVIARAKSTALDFDRIRQKVEAIGRPSKSKDIGLAMENVTKLLSVRTVAQPTGL